MFPGNSANTTDSPFIFLPDDCFNHIISCFPLPDQKKIWKVLTQSCKTLQETLTHYSDKQTINQLSMSQPAVIRIKSLAKIFATSNSIKLSSVRRRDYVNALLNFKKEALLTRLESLLVELSLALIRMDSGEILSEVTQTNFLNKLVDIYFISPQQASIIAAVFYSVHLEKFRIYSKELKNFRTQLYKFMASFRFYSVKLQAEFTKEILPILLTGQFMFEKTFSQIPHQNQDIEMWQPIWIDLLIPKDMIDRCLMRCRKIILDIMPHSTPQKIYRKENNSNAKYLPSDLKTDLLETLCKYSKYPILQLKDPLSLLRALFNRYFSQSELNELQQYTLLLLNKKNPQLYLSGITLLSLTADGLSSEQAIIAWNRMLQLISIALREHEGKVIAMRFGQALDQLVKQIPLQGCLEKIWARIHANPVNSPTVKLACFFCQQIPGLYQTLDKANTLMLYGLVMKAFDTQMGQVTSEAVSVLAMLNTRYFDKSQVDKVFQLLHKINFTEDEIFCVYEAFAPVSTPEQLNEIYEYFKAALIDSSLSFERELLLNERLRLLLPHSYYEKRLLLLMDRFASNKIDKHECKNFLYEVMSVYSNLTLSQKNHFLKTALITQYEIYYQQCNNHFMSSEAELDHSDTAIAQVAEFYFAQLLLIFYIDLGLSVFNHLNESACHPRFTEYLETKALQEGQPQRTSQKYETPLKHISGVIGPKAQIDNTLLSVLYYLNSEMLVKIIRFSFQFQTTPDSKKHQLSAHKNEERNDSVGENYNILLFYLIVLFDRDYHHRDVSNLVTTDTLNGLMHTLLEITPDDVLVECVGQISLSKIGGPFEDTPCSIVSPRGRSYFHDSFITALQGHGRKKYVLYEDSLDEDTLLTGKPQRM